MLQNHTILITGAGSGLGLGIAKYCKIQGAQVIVTDIDQDKSDAVTRSAYFPFCEYSPEWQALQHIKEELQSPVFLEYVYLGPIKPTINILHRKAICINI